MIGTIVNTACIIVGSLVGTLFKKGLGEKYRTILFNAMGLASLALGANSFAQNMPKSEFPVLFILSLALGGIAGTALDIDDRTKRLVQVRGRIFRPGPYLSLPAVLYRNFLYRRPCPQRPAG